MLARCKTVYFNTSVLKQKSSLEKKTHNYCKQKKNHDGDTLISHRVYCFMLYVDRLAAPETAGAFSAEPAEKALGCSISHPPSSLFCSAPLHSRLEMAQWSPLPLLPKPAPLHRKQPRPRKTRKDEAFSNKNCNLIKSDPGQSSDGQCQDTVWIMLTCTFGPWVPGGEARGNRAKSLANKVPHPCEATIRLANVTETLGLLLFLAYLCLCVCVCVCFFVHFH